MLDDVESSSRCTWLTSRGERWGPAAKLEAPKIDSPVLPAERGHSSPAFSLPPC